jgi:hypothetical protein
VEVNATDEGQGLDRDFLRVGGDCNVNTTITHCCSNGGPASQKRAEVQGPHKPLQRLSPALSCLQRG